MKKKTAAIIMSVVMSVSILAGCGADKETDTGTESAASEESEISEEILADTEADAAGVPAEEQSVDVTEKEAEENGNDTAADPPEEEDAADDAGVTVRIGSLKGPTSMGLVYLMDQSEKGETVNRYEFTMTAAADELLPAMLSGDLDIVLIPANVASVLYNKAEGDVAVIDINTLGVLYMVSGNDKIKNMEDLKGQTIYMTGKGTTPDYVMQYLLKENGLTTADVTMEYKSEATEVAAVLAGTPDAVGVLPQPFVTAACAQNDKLSVVMDLTEQWASVQGEGGSSLVTGVTVVRKGFLDQNPEAVEQFMEEHAASASYANEHVEEAAELVAATGIIDKAEVAARAIPECNITYIDGEEMETALSGYLAVLWEQDPASVGGGLPGEDFYYK
ncbi:MAG: ABC transporter substrate-binding protein [Lachnospiraceae bacterium]|nr:ABC transporter substrate-binding protein [Lachnospiraceae bacterium]